MATLYGANIVRDGLVLSLDAANPKSYPGSGIRINNLADKDLTPHAELQFDYDTYGDISNGYVTMGGSGEDPLGNSGTFLRGFGDIGSTVNDDFTTTGWLYRLDNRYETEILDYRGDSRRISFAIFDSYMRFYQRESLSPYTTNNTSVYNVTNELNTWDFFALSKQDTSYSFYKNGTYIGTTNYQLTETISGSSYSIGISWSDDDYPSRAENCRVGPILHYTKALTESEIQQNFNATRGRFGI